MNRTVVLASMAALSATLLLLASSGAAQAGDSGPPDAADSLAEARSLLLAAKYAEAENLLRKSAATQKQAAPTSAEYAATLDLLGELHTVLANYARADDCFREAAAIFQQRRGQSVRYAGTLAHRAKALTLRAHYTEAGPLIDESLAVLANGKLKKSVEYAKALVVLADLQWAQGKKPEAHNTYSRAIELFKAKASDQSAECATAQNNLGLLDRSDKSEDLIRAAMDTRKALVGEHHPDYANSLTSLAIVLRSQDKSSDVEPLLKRALEIRKEALGERHPDYATTLNSLASFYRERGYYLRAEPEARRAAEICEQSLGAKHPYYAAALNNLAFVYRSEANFVDAQRAFSQAIGIYDATLVPGHPYSVTARQNLAELYETHGDRQGAKRLLDQVGDARRRSAKSDPRGYAMWLVAMARLERADREFDDAKTRLLTALEWLKKVPGSELDRATALEERALVELAISNLTKDKTTRNKSYWSANAQLQEVLEIRSRLLGRKHPDYATALESQASLCRAFNFLAEAETRYQIVLQLRQNALGAQHRECALALANLAATHRAQGNVAAAEQEYKQALGIVLKHLNMTAVAQSEQQQFAMMHTARSYLDEYLSLMIGQSVPRDELYGEVLAWKGAVSRRQQMLRKMRRAIEEENPEIAVLYRELDAASRQLEQSSYAGPRPGDEAAQGRELDQLSDTVDRLQRDLAAKSADFRRDVESRSRTPEDLRQALPDNVALVDLLEYWNVPKFGNSPQRLNPVRRLIAFIIRHEGSTELIDLGPVEDIEGAVGDWLDRLLKGVEQPGKKDPGSRLRQLIWAPLENHVSDAETVLVSPDGATAWIPWAALPAKEPGKFLIETRSFVMLPVPQMLPDMLASGVTSTDDSPTLLVVGDIDYGAAPGKADVASAKRSAVRGKGDDVWRRLAATKAEMAQVVDAFGHAYPDAPSVMALRGSSATEEAVRASAAEHRFLHFATHGFFKPRQASSAARGLNSADLAPGDRAARSEVAGFHPGLLSGIVLAGANRPAKLDEDDGILTALEVEQLRLSGVELVTLSACQTGIGNTVSGEGLLGLQRAFQVAGARSVLATLWTVDDAPTARLMAAFYDNLWRKKLSRAEALRQAQIDMLNDRTLPGNRRGMEFSTPRPDKNRRPSPYYWAAFVLSGDWR